MLEFLTRRQLMLLAAIVAGSAVSGYIVPTEAAKLIATNQIADGAITTPKLADEAVTLVKFGTGVADSLKGTNGLNGANGINCWDLNGDGVNDASEDVNNDNAWNALDCQGSSEFVPNSAPVVDAGNDQEIVGTLTSGGGGSLPSFTALSCSFDLDGSVEDDDFTGYLTHTWTGGLSIITDDQLTGTAVLIWTQPSTQGPITLPIVAVATLTADDGIIVVSDTVQLTCDVPA